MVNAKNEQLLEFNKIFEEKVKPLLLEHEEFRKHELKKFILPLCVLPLVFIYSVLLMLCLPCLDEMGLLVQPYKGILAEFAFFGTFLGVLSIPFVVHYAFKLKKTNEEFVKLLKAETLENILKIFGNIKWDSQSSSSWVLNSELEKSGLFIPFNRKKTDDEFKGTWKGVDYKIAELNLWDEHGTGKNRSVTPVFNGIVISFKSNKHIQNRTVVASKGNLTRKNDALTASIIACLFPSILFLKFGFNPLILLGMIVLIAISIFSYNQSMKYEEPLNNVAIEDPLFSKKFNSYSSDQVEARYLLSPSFMERFYNLKTTFNTSRIKCSFFDDEFMIAISTNENLFEVGNLFHSIIDTNSHKKLFNDLNSILQMVEYFKLDEKTGL